MQQAVVTTNTILYCRKWEKTVMFYRDGLHLPVLFYNEWFVEFRLNAFSRISIADEARCSVKSSMGAGMTLSLEVNDIETVRKTMVHRGVKPSEIRFHPWDARVFYVHDPEGYRIEIWQRPASDKK